jgi:hypothetical protein
MPHHPDDKPTNPPPASRPLRFPVSARAKRAAPMPDRPQNVPGERESSVGDDVIARFAEVTKRMNNVARDLGCAGRIDGKDDPGRPRAA